MDAGQYTALVSISPASNYTLTGNTTQDFSITQKVLELDFTSILAKLASLPYSGEVYIDITPDTMPTLDSGAGAGDVYPQDNLGTGVVLEIGNAKWCLSGSDVAGGPYDLNIDGDFALSGNRSSNYALVPGQSWQAMSNVANIAPRPLIFSWELDGKPISGSTVNVPYDGKVHTVTAIITNAVTGQVLTVDSYTVPSTLSEAAEGSYIATVATVASGNGSATDPANYTLSGATNATLTWNIVGSGPVVDKTDLAAFTGKVLSEKLHEENFKAAAWKALKTALKSANTVLGDAKATQPQVDKALAALKAAYGALKHDHPVLKHSNDTKYGGVKYLTKFGQTVKIEFKGDIRDVVGFKLNGKKYLLTPKERSGKVAYSITKKGKVIGTITKGSAVVTLPKAFSDRLANGTHKVEVVFKDAIGTGRGKADLIVKRSTGNGGNGNDPGKGSAITPKTGDDMQLGLMFAISVISLCALLFILFALRRKQKEKL
ncbi:hypothetical protein FACS18947_6940 [Bacteroidia bacterium]|nr:hypothetical protein FACS18947_6940 [Bacteroidia bacterium]